MFCFSSSSLSLFPLCCVVFPLPSLCYTSSTLSPFLPCGLCFAFHLLLCLCFLCVVWYSHCHHYVIHHQLFPLFFLVAYVLLFIFFFVFVSSVLCGIPIAITMLFIINSFPFSSLWLMFCFSSSSLSLFPLCCVVFPLPSLCYSSSTLSPFLPCDL